jgi:hypothetical protein
VCLADADRMHIGVGREIDINTGSPVAWELLKRSSIKKNRSLVNRKFFITVILRPGSYYMEHTFLGFRYSLVGVLRSHTQATVY